MTVTTSVTKIELSADERDILRKAYEILNKVTDVFDNDKMDCVTDKIDMHLYNLIYDEINIIEDYIRIE